MLNRILHEKVLRLYLEIRSRCSEVGTYFNMIWPQKSKLLRPLHPLPTTPSTPLTHRVPSKTIPWTLAKIRVTYCVGGGFISYDCLWNSWHLLLFPAAGMFSTGTPPLVPRNEAKTTRCKRGHRSERYSSCTLTIKHIFCGFFTITLY
jgi:hypothetical protein